MRRPDAIWTGLCCACLLAGCSPDDESTASVAPELPPGVVELDPSSREPDPSPPACDPSQCPAADARLSSGPPPPACCTDDGQCGALFGAACVRVELDPECASSPLGMPLVGCCRDDALCGELNLQTGACADLPSAAQSLEVARASLGRVSALPVRRIDCDGYLSVRCGETECPESPLGPAACCLPDGSCGLTPDGFSCYLGAIVDVDDCASTAPAYLPCCSAGGFCGLLQDGQCGLTPSLTLRECNTEADCRGATQRGCCLDGVSCGTLDPIGGGCRERQAEPQPFEIVYRCDGRAFQRCDLGELCSVDACCLPGGVCGVYDESGACTPA